ncbi:hypothetical protein AMTR_s00026p00072550 [Amborella trichopoda]|uniref:START domain-containing protein n=2 Tax=Amborella trichopoda TaxID=13333 RepID=W1PRA0_AMBTC|nr:hypothetical protein AMTR_s00026p00072550 [Amborella trichopoda]
MSDKEGSDGSETGSEERSVGYSGWVYHLGVNSIGREYCHLRYLVLRGQYVQMYKRDPIENRGLKPIRKGVVGPSLMVEERGRKKINHGDVYVLRFCTPLDDTKKGEIACASAGDARKWMEAFEQAKQQAEHALLRGGSRHINNENELNLEGHRRHVRRYAFGLRKLISIGKGPEKLLRQASNLGSDIRSDRYIGGDVGDAVEPHQWKCVQAVNGIRIFEDVAETKKGKGVLVKSVGVVDASLDTVFEVVVSLDKRQRYEWDMLTADLEILDSSNGHYDIVYGTFDPKYLSWWHSKRDFVFSRQWFHCQDGSYIILQSPVVHKKQPPKSGYRRTKLNPSIWEIRRLDPSTTKNARCIVTQMMEIHSSGWGSWKKHHFSKFEKTIPYALLCQVAGLREYFGANPTLANDSPTVVRKTFSDTSDISVDFEDAESKDEFYDAISADVLLENEDSDDDDDDDDDEVDITKEGKIKLKNVSWALTSLALKSKAVSDATNQLDIHSNPISIDASQFHGSLHQGKDQTDSNCWTEPGGEGFMIRGKTYLTDFSKVPGGDPVLKLLAVDWFMADSNVEKVALHPKCLVQSNAGKKLPFIFVVNLEVPATPNYSLVLYYGADRPLKTGSLLHKFVEGSDVYRNARFKLIPRIIEGYWMVKRAVGTKACLLGKAVTCKFLRQDNYLEIDVDIGSSSVARSIIGLVLGYITSLVVDLAILIEAKEEKELPEHILGTVRLNRVKLDSAVQI